MNWPTLFLVKLAILALGITVPGLCLLIFRTRRREIVAGLVALLLSIFLAEGFLRLFYPQIMEHDQMFEYDPYLGWRFIPNQSGSIVYSGEARHYIKTNSWGFRDNSPPLETDNIKKILVLGDSFVTNVAVRDNEVFTQFMERQLKNTAVLNFGVNGYGQVQEYLLLQQWLDKVNPQLVIVVIYIRNDFQDNIGADWLYPRPFASWDGQDTTLKINPPSLPPPNRSLQPFWKFYKGSHVNHLLDKGLSLLANKVSQSNQGEYRPSLYTPPELYLCRSQLSEETKLMYRTMEELLLMIAHYVDKRGIRLVFAIAPSVVQVEDDLWSSTLRTSGEKAEYYLRSLPNDKLIQFANKNNLLMIDLLPMLISETKRGKTLYNRKEQHWNSDGNRVVAHALTAYLKTRSLIE